MLYQMYFKLIFIKRREDYTNLKFIMTLLYHADRFLKQHFLIPFLRGQHSEVMRHCRNNSV